MPLISVILPAYNAEKFIKEAVQSILDQTVNDFELIVINDASTDGTLDILQSFNDSRISIINNEINLKVVKSLNKGLELAKGEFIARMDADDISLPNRFEKQLQYFKQHPEVDICGTWVEVFDGGNAVFKPYEKHEDIRANLLFLNEIVHPSVMMRKSSLINHHLSYEESFINAEDYGLWVAAMDKLRFANVQEVLLRYRLHANNVSFFQNEIPSDVKAMNIKAYKRVLQNLGVTYTESDLDTHISFGLKRLTDLSKENIEKCLSWFQLIVASNNQRKYFNKKSLRNVVMHQLFFLVKKVKAQPNLYKEVFKVLLRLYSITDYLDYVRYICKRKFLANNKNRFRMA
jgi:glycosyltransferase involved in cell wall biosynthesis